jgi:hypothetical protein
MIPAGRSRIPGSSDTLEAAVNLELFLDGSGDYWVMPVTVGDKPLGYHWMPYRVGQAAKADELAKKIEE